MEQEKHLAASGTDRAGREPAYLRIYRKLRKEILEGVYSYGERLPSKRFLAETTGTSVITADHALSLLVEEGYLEARQRSGYYCIYRAGEAFLAPGEGGTSSADIGETGEAKASEEESGDPAESYWNPEETFPFPALARTMRGVLTRYGERILVKSPNYGVPELRHAIAAYLGRNRGIVVAPEQVIIGSGSEYMYTLLVQMIGRDKIYGLENPSYPQIRRVYSACGAETELLSMGSRGIRSSALAGSKAQVLHVTPFHSYPTGVTADASKRAEYIRWAGRRGGMIIEDDMDSEFTMASKAEDTIFSLEPGHSVIYMNTFSRTVAPSIRCGYMVLPKEKADSMKAAIAFYSCTVPVFEQYVLTELIQSGEFERHINRVRRQLRRQRG